jgi:hypothetical protein
MVEEEQRSVDGENRTDLPRGEKRAEGLVYRVEGARATVTARALGIGRRFAKALEDPRTAALTAGGAVLAAAIVWGASEAAVAAAAGYVAYRIVKRQRSRREEEKPAS